MVKAERELIITLLVSMFNGLINLVLQLQKRTKECQDLIPTMKSMRP